MKRHSSRVYLKLKPRKKLELKADEDGFITWGELILGGSLEDAFDTIKFLWMSYVKDDSCKLSRGALRLRRKLKSYFIEVKS